MGGDGRGGDWHVARSDGGKANNWPGTSFEACAAHCAPAISWRHVSKEASLAWEGRGEEGMGKEMHGITES